MPLAKCSVCKEEMPRSVLGADDRCLRCRSDEPIEPHHCKKCGRGMIMHGQGFTSDGRSYSMDECPVCD